MERKPDSYEDTELESLFEEDSFQTQEELAVRLEMTKQVISSRSNSYI